MINKEIYIYKLIQLTKSTTLSKKIIQLERQFKNFFLPKFDIGQFVWTIKGTKFVRLKIESISLSKDNIFRYFLVCDEYYLSRCEHEIFITKQEALQGGYF